MLISLTGWVVVAGAIYLVSALLPQSFWPWGLSSSLIYVFRKRTKRFAKLERQLPEALDMLAERPKVGAEDRPAIGRLSRGLPQEPLARESRKQPTNKTSASIRTPP